MAKKSVSVSEETGEIIEETRQERRAREISEEKQEERNARKAERLSPVNKVIVNETIRKETGRRRISFDYSNCIDQVDHTQARDTDLNYLVKKFTPYQLGQYIAARSQSRKEIIGHDFSREPDLQSAKNEVYRLEQAFRKLPEEVQNKFKNSYEFLKFIDNPANAEQMVKLNLLTKKEIQTVQDSVKPNATNSNDANNTTSPNSTKP